MVCFIVSLQLPYTVNFHESPTPDIAKNKSRNPFPSSRVGPSLDSVTRLGAPVTPPRTPPKSSQPATIGDELFFQLSLDDLSQEDREKLLKKNKEATPSQQRVLLTRASTLPVVPQLNDVPEDTVRSRSVDAQEEIDPAGALPDRPSSAASNDAAIASGTDTPSTSGSPGRRSRQLSHSPSARRNWRRRPSHGDDGTRYSTRRESFTTSAWTIETTDQGNGGLRNAVYAALNEGDMQDRVWVGTLGIPTDHVDEKTRIQIKETLADKFDSLVVYTNNKVLDGHYARYCKEILWPVFHNQIPDDPDNSSYEHYVAMNKAVAATIIENYQEGDVIWVHDYHLLLVPLMIRDALPDAKIGFFLHSAFPSSEVFRCLAARQELLEGILGSTLVGLQTEEYARHFLQTCSRLLCVEAKKEGILLEDRLVHVTDLSIGIDPKYLKIKRNEPVVAELGKRIRERYGNRKLIVARDKMDHIRGIKAKLQAFELFLHYYPEWADKVVLIQVALSTTEDPELRDQVHEIISRINSHYGSLDHSPVVFLYQDIPFSQYLALLTESDALVVTSLREGMNLTSHEFIECQEGKYGALLLSEFTGSSAVLQGAFDVNPWDHRGTADLIKRALELPADEAKERWEKMHKAVNHNTGAYWVREFLSRLDEAWAEEERRASATISKLTPTELKRRYQQASKRLFFLDFEGTLASWGSPTETILTNPQRIISVLHDLLQDKNNIVYVMSGRKPEELDRIFKRVPGVGLIAEVGAYIRPFESETWTHVCADKLDWKQSVQEILEFYVERTPGTFIERRWSSLIFHYKAAEDILTAGRQARECANHINDQYESQHVHAVPVEGAVIVEPTDCNKATAAATVFSSLAESETSVDFLLVMGNDREDEVIYQWAEEQSGNIKDIITVNVGLRNTSATYCLTQGVAGALYSLNAAVSSTTNLTAI